jgi:hypothetical protein
MASDFLKGHYFQSRRGKKARVGIHSSPPDRGLASCHGCATGVDLATGIWFKSIAETPAKIKSDQVREKTVRVWHFDSIDACIKDQYNVMHGCVFSATVPAKYKNMRNCLFFLKKKLVCTGWSSELPEKVAHARTRMHAWCPLTFFFLAKIEPNQT